MRYTIVDVFTETPLAGNALAVFPDGAAIDPALMQRIAREMNLSETSFVTASTPGGYDVRIFTPAEELPFAGHPTLGTSWTLRRLGMIASDAVTQHSAAGETPVRFEGNRVWLERTGSVDDDHPDPEAVARALGLDAASLWFDASEIGLPASALRPGAADAGTHQLIVPIADARTLEAMRAPADLQNLPAHGVYCIAPLGPGHIKARFFAPGIGVTEDPATGSAAASLGLYLAARAGTIDVTISQGDEVARPSTLHVQAEPGHVRVGGSVVFVADGTMGT